MSALVPTPEQREALRLFANAKITGPDGSVNGSVPSVEERDAPEILIARTNTAYPALQTLLDRYPTREALERRLDEIGLERLYIVSLLDPEKQAHYEGVER